MNRAHSLLALQKVDRGLDAIGARLRAITVELAGNPKLAAANEALARAEEIATDLERRLRAVNLERSGLKDHIAAEESKLYGGRVQAPKELQALEREVGSLKRRMATLDDESLGLLLERDVATEARDAALGARNEIEQSTGERFRKLAADRDDLEVKQAALSARREAMAASIDSASVAAYERVRRSKHGIAVAELGPEGCASCGIQLPRSAVETVRGSDELIRCPGCGRILAG
jgi:predicted  nucleic acid-binding Zn-ribbon protein